MSDVSIANIANPIYDGALKYLLDDNKVARIFLSALIGTEILELDFRPTEHNLKLSQVDFTVFRMDFAAKVRTEDGRDKMILLEIQKAKLASDVMRFRRYLGTQYASADNVVVREAPSLPDAASGSAKSLRYDKPGKPLELFTIYFLGRALLHTKEPVVWVRRDLYELGGDPTHRIEGPREEFIDQLTHDSIVVQIPHLKARRRTDLERLLAIFDQSQQLPGNGHILSLQTDGMPERYAKVVRRLVKAAAEPKVVEEMDLEDTFVRELQEQARLAATALQREQEARKWGEEERRLKEEERRLKEEAHKREEHERRLKEEALAEIERLNRLLKQNRES